MGATGYAVWECRSLGNVNNSGCFDPGITFSATLSSGNATSSFPTITASNYSFVSDDINHYLYIKSGANWRPGWYQITGIAGTSAIVNADSYEVLQLNKQYVSAVGIGTSGYVTAGSWSIDYTQSASTKLLLSDLYLTTTSRLASLGTSFTPNYLGNSIRITASTSGISTGLYVISSLTGYQANLDRVAGSTGGTGGTGYLGGGISDPSIAFRDVKTIVGGYNCIYVKADAEYNKTESSYQAGGGIPHIFGYSTKRHDNGRPIMNLNARDARYFGSGDGNSTRCRNFYIKTFDNRGTSLMTNGNNQPYSYIVNCINEGTPTNSASGLTYIFCSWNYLNGYFSNGFFNTIFDHAGNTTMYGGIAGGTITYNAYYQNCIIFLGYRSSTSPIWNNPGQHSGQIIKNNIFIDGTGGFLLSYENFSPFGNHSPSFIYNNLFSNNRGTMFGYGGGYTNFSFFIENNYFHNCVAALGTTSPQNYASSKSLNINNVVISTDPFKNRNAFDIRLDADVFGGNIPRFNSLLENFTPSITKRNKDVGSIQSYSKAIKINMNGGMRG
jgi:hypothetical protein